MCIIKYTDLLIDKFFLKRYKIKKHEKEQSGILFAGIIGGAMFGLLGNLVANYIWNAILSSNATETQKIWGFFDSIVFFILVFVYWRLTIRLLN